MELVLAFVTVSFITVVSPGPSTFLVLRHARHGGLRLGLATVAGILAADTMFLLAGALGVATVLSSAPHLLVLLKAAGAVYFGRQAWLAAAPYFAVAMHTASRPAAQTAPTMLGASSAHLPDDASGQVAGRVGGRVAAVMASAFTLHGLNVKALLFFAMLVPQFIHAELPLPGQVALLLALHLSVATTVLLAYVRLGMGIANSIYSLALSRAIDLTGAFVMGSLSLGILWSIGHVTALS